MYKNILKFVKRAWKRLISDQAGSAIILALIIIAGLAGTGIGAARLAKSNTQQTTLFEDSLKAFYASEAGVEAALLEWRFNHDVELWNRDNAFDCADTFYGGGDPAICDKVILTRAVTLDKQTTPDDPVQDITSNIYDEDGQVKPDAQYPSNQPWYELRMYYRDPYMPVRGNVLKIDDTDANPIRIDKDETFEIRFPDDDIDHVRLQWMPTYESWLTEGDEIRLLWQPVVEDADGNAVTYDDENLSLAQREYFSDKYDIVYKKDFNIDSAKFGSGVKVLRVKAQIKTSVSDYDVNRDKKGVFMTLESFNNSFELIHVPGNQVTIEVVGHYNNISRSVEYTLDRQTGTVMDIFDYGVFSKEDLVK